MGFKSKTEPVPSLPGEAQERQKEHREQKALDVPREMGPQIAPRNVRCEGILQTETQRESLVICVDGDCKEASVSGQQTMTRSGQAIPLPVLWPQGRHRTGIWALMRVKEKHEFTEIKFLATWRKG